MKKCKPLTNLTHVAPGWGCCRCRTYNGLQRTHCKSCEHGYCGPPIVMGPEGAIAKESQGAQKEN